MARIEGPHKSRRDPEAADIIRRLRVNEGFGRDSFVHAIRAKGVKAGYDAARFAVSADTIRLIEETGREPVPRIKFAIAFYFDLRPGQIWKRDSLERVGIVLDTGRIAA